MFTVRNTVVVALLQVGVIIFGVLGIRSSQDGLGSPAWFFPTVDYGPFALVIPLLWTVIVLGLCQCPGMTVKFQNRAFFSGIIILLMLGLLITVLWSGAGQGWGRRTTVKQNP